MNPIQLTKLLSDEQKLKILSSTFRVPKSINQLSTTLGIPLTACYRRTKELEAAGLLEMTERKLTREGKRVSLYRSNLKSAYLTFEDGKMKSFMEISGRGTVEDSEIYSISS
jgi:DNA-binding Lrp family transcriptional regulator